MFAIQERLPLARHRTRSARRLFAPAQGRGTYRLPHDVRDRLIAALLPFRNREAAFALAVFLARFWSMPGRVALPFPIDRRALSGRLPCAGHGVDYPGSALGLVVEMMVVMAVPPPERWRRAA
jgi:hypothetical protein